MLVGRPVVRKIVRGLGYHPRAALGVMVCSACMMPGHNMKTCPRLKGMRIDDGEFGAKRARKLLHHVEDPVDATGATTMRRPRGFVPAISEDGQLEYAECPRGYYPVKDENGQVRHRTHLLTLADLDQELGLVSGLHANAVLRSRLSSTKT